VIVLVLASWSYDAYPANSEYLRKPAHACQGVNGQAGRGWMERAKGIKPS